MSIPEDNKVKNTGYPLLITIVAVAVLAALSLVPWSKITDSKLKDYSLISDLKPSETDSVVGGYEFIDPELLALMEDTAFIAQHNITNKLESPVQNVEEAVADVSNTAKGNGNDAAATQSDSESTGEPEQPLVNAKKPRAGEKMVIEDYTPTGAGLVHLKQALGRRGSRPVRIGVIGDSYIEGDIFTSDIRKQMQDKYGGRGVGYMAAHSQVAGFRPTVKHSSSGWKQHPVAEAAKSKYFTLAGEYYTGQNGATIKFNGVKNMGHLGSWNNSQLVFVAPSAGKITLETDNGSQTYDVAASDAVQSITLTEETSSLKVTNNVPGLVLLGAWLNDANGVVVDCMSVRGDSGVNRRGVSTELSSQLRSYVDYDLIIVEYGINALTSKQKDYTMYGNTMTEVIKRLKQCYPNADIILMGIGDRGQKINGEAQSFSTAQYMVDAQRNAARKAGVLFYDTRESMGGDGAIVKWRNDKLVNGDYIHLNFKGGKALADIFVDALVRKLGE